MAYKPILFNTEMVKAILEGRKTQTRRIVKFGVADVYDVACINAKWHESYDPQNPPEPLVEWFVNDIVRKPFIPGDILWVRETWHRYEKRVGKGGTCRIETFFGYRASIANSEDSREPWKPSIHMPKEAARIFLRVKNVRLEPLKKMQAFVGDIFDEGVNNLQEFIDVWNGTMKPADLPKYGWDANPWVWVIEFERYEKPESW